MAGITNPVSTPEQRAGVISTARTNGDQYNSAAKAGLAHELAAALTGDKLPNGVAARLVESTGFDKGTVSRVATIVRNDKQARNAALKLDVMKLDGAAPGSPELAAFVKVGLLFVRKPSASTTPKVKGESEDIDALAVMTDWLETATDEQFAARVALVNSTVARLTAARNAPVAQTA